jgi:hypothetical protein
MMFMLGANANVSTDVNIALPIGINIIVEVGLSGDILGVYRLSTIYYNDALWQREYVEYSPATFSMFSTSGGKVRMEGAIYLTVTLDINVGVGVLIFDVMLNNQFTFDFAFGFREGQNGTAIRGDMRYRLNMDIKVLGFSVYNPDFVETTVSLVRQNDHGSIPASPLSAVSNLMSVNEPLDINPLPRDYLANVSAWNGGTTISGAGGKVLSLFSSGSGNIEHEIKSGLYPQAEVKIADLANGWRIMVFIDDDPARTSINRGAAYYSLYDGSVWGTPVQLDPDGTLDAYIDISDLGDRLAITWSSADEVLPSHASMTEVLHSLNIKCVFIDKTSRVISSITKLTKKTTEDFGANLRATVAYDTDNPEDLIAFYTKIEFAESMTDTKDLLGDYSVVAYRCFRDGMWEDTYTSGELAGIGNAVEYTTNWYGQRFLDVRLDKGSSFVPTVFDSGSAISYNGLALFAYVIDHDNNLGTADDRDILMQIYDFGKDEFSYIIRVSNTTGAYGKPQFARHENNTYLFYTSNRIEIIDEDGNIKLDQAGIQYINVSDIISGGFYRVNAAGYYDLISSRTDGGDVFDMKLRSSILADGQTAVSDYRVTVSDDEKMYIFWVTGETKPKAGLPEGADFNNANNQSLEYHIYGSMFHSNPMHTSVPGVAPPEQIAEVHGFGGKVKLTGGEDVRYNLFDAYVKGNTVNIATGKSGMRVIGGAKAPDDSNIGLVLLEHTPFTRLTAEIVTESYYHNASEQATVILYNEGLKPSSGEIVVALSLVQGGNITPIGTETFNASISGGGTARIEFLLPRLTVTAGAVLRAEIINNGQTTIRTKPMPYDYNIVPIFSDAGYVEGVGSVAILEFTNEGNKPFENMRIEVYASQPTSSSYTLVAVENVTAAAPLETLFVERIFSLNEALLQIETIAETGDVIGKSKIEFRIYDGNTLHKTFYCDYIRHFDASVMAANSKVLAVIAPSASTLRMLPGDIRRIDSTLVPSSAADTNVLMYESSNESIATVNDKGEITALREGIVTISVYSLPNIEFLRVTPYMTVEKIDIREKIPAAELKRSDIMVIVGLTEVSPPLPTLPGQPPVEKPGLPSEWIDSSEFRNIFNDLDTSSWYYNAIAFVVANGLFRGVSENSFEPEGTMTRGMLVTVIHRMVDMPAPAGLSRFTDVAGNSWYADAVAWSAENGIVNGIGENQFAPNDNMTREHMAVILYRFAQYLGIAPVGNLAIHLDFADTGDVSDWAVEAMMYCVMNGIILGKSDNLLDPQGWATRAEMAVMLYRFINAME